MRYRCLILDHDDTVTDSTRTIHYPAYLRMMKELRPAIETLSLEGWMCRNFDPGILGFLTGELGMDARELEREYEIWRSFSVSSDPPFFPGLLVLLESFREAGGKIGVVSHSEADIIARNYRVASGGSFEPDAIYGWELAPERRKPSPWPVLDLLERFGVERTEALVIDDLKPGVDMARAAGVAVAGAGWAYVIPGITDYMRGACDLFFDTVSGLASHVLDDEAAAAS